MTKDEARSESKKAIAKMSDAEKEWASGAICDALSGLDEFTHAKNPFIFLGTDSEPNTEEVIGLALMLERTVSVPRIESGEMKSICITPFTNFRKNKWGILEPAGGRATDIVDVAVIPLVAFDEKLNRLGHGGGYYDKYLEIHECFKIGIAFDCQQNCNLPTCAHDIPLDMVVTEKRIIDENGSRPNPFYDL